MRVVLFLAMLPAAAGCRSPSTDDWLRQLKDPDVTKRREAIRELGSRSGEATHVVPALTEALADESSYVRHDAATTLGKFGPEAREAVPALTTALKDRDHGVRVAAGAALKRIDPHAAKNPGATSTPKSGQGRP